MNDTSQGNTLECMASFEPTNELNTMAHIETNLHESLNTINFTTTETLHNSSCLNWWADFYQKILRIHPISRCCKQLNHFRNAQHRGIGWLLKIVCDFIIHTAIELIFDRIQWHPSCPRWVSFVKYINWGISRKLIISLNQ